MMYELTDKCILLFFSLLAFPFRGTAPQAVFAFFLALSVSAVLCAFPGPVVRCAALSACGFLQIFLPELCIFLPLLSYDLFPIPAQKESRDERSACPGGCEPASSAKKEIRLRAVGFSAPALMSGSFLWRALCRKSFGTEHPFLPLRFRFLFLLSGCILAALLRRKTAQTLLLKQRLLRTTDDDTELRLLLEERSRSFLEKQDNEIYTATLRERNRIAREIHDNVGHILTRAILIVGALKTVCRDSSVSELFSQLSDTLNTAMDSIRTSVHDLHDSSVNLEDTLQSMAREFSFCPVSLQYRMSPEIPREVRYCLIAVAREALVNISRHSGATQASITAVEHPGFYQFIIQDNGGAAHGTAAGNALRTEAENLPAGETSGMSGIGLENIRSRVRDLRGNLQISAKNGFRIYITIPRA